MGSWQRLWLIGPVIAAAVMGFGWRGSSALRPYEPGVPAAAEQSAQALATSPLQGMRARLYFPFAAKMAVDWPQFGFDSAHSGVNSHEYSITPSNVGSLRLGFQVSLRAVADGAPAYLHDVMTPSGQRDLLFVTTVAGHIQALDASTGQELWWHQHGPGNCLINNNTSRNETCYTTSSPAIEPDGKYIYSYGMDGYVHKYAVGDGREVVGGGWPELATRKVYDEKGSSALSIATARNGTTYLYVTNGGYPGDGGNYQGHVTAINLVTGAQVVFSALCSTQAIHFVDSRVTAGPDCWPIVQSAIWARPGVVYDAVTDRILMATGNGTFLPGGSHWGETVIALHPDGTGAGPGLPLDTYTPTNYQALNDQDADIGSTAPALLPPSGGKYPYLAVQGGKDARLRLLNRTNLSGHGASGFTGGEVFSMAVPMGGEVLTQPTVWVNPQDRSTWVFVVNDLGTTGLQLVIDGSGAPSLVARWTRAGAANAGTSPVLANNILFAATSNLITARSPTIGELLWSNNQIGAIHWASPIVVNGMVYITDSTGKLTAYRLP